MCDPLPCKMDQHQFEVDGVPDPMFAAYDGDLPWRHDDVLEPEDTVHIDMCRRVVCFTMSIAHPRCKHRRSVPAR
jgi:hypothetical protein